MMYLFNHCLRLNASLNRPAVCRHTETTRRPIYCGDHVVGTDAGVRVAAVDDL
jgi:hypothetical protein